MNRTHPRRRQSFLKTASILLAAASILALFVCGTVFYRLFFAGNRSDSRLLTVPALTGKILNEDSLDGTEYFQVVRIDRFSDAPPGTVLAQSPAAGTERKAVAGKRYVTLTLYVSKGIETAEVPSVVGLSAAEGESTLLSLGFAVERIERYDNAPAGVIVEQSRESGTVFQKGGTVTLTVSRGAAIRRVSLPDLSGLTSICAKSLLQSLGLRLGRIDYRTSSGGEGLVLTQSPLPGTSLPEGARIDLLLSKKPAETSETERAEAPDEPKDDGDESGDDPISEPSDRKQSTAHPKQSEPPHIQDESDRDSELNRMLDRFFEQYLPEISHNQTTNQPKREKQ